MPTPLTVKRADGTTSRTQVLLAVEASAAAAIAMLPELRDSIPVGAYFAVFIGLKGLHAYFRATTTQGLK